MTDHQARIMAEAFADRLFSKYVRELGHAGYLRKPVEDALDAVRDAADAIKAYVRGRKCQ